MFAIFGHGNVAGMGEALAAARTDPADLSRAQRAGDGARRDRLRQGNAPPPDDGLHDLVGPGATNIVTAAALAHVEPPAGAAAAGRHICEPPARPGTAADRGLRRPDRYGERLPAARCRATGTGSRGRSSSCASLPQAISVLHDPADCGPVTLALPQDVQAEAFDYPAVFLRATRARHRAARGPTARSSSRRPMR